MDAVQLELDRMDGQRKTHPKGARVGSAKSHRKMDEDMKFLQKLEDMGNISSHDSAEKVSKRGMKKKKSAAKEKHGDSSQNKSSNKVIR